MQKEIVLCGSSAYTQKYYLNEEFNSLPEGIKDELKIMCVLYTEDIGGTLALVFDEEGNLQFQAAADEGDLLYDDIGSVLKIKQLQREKQDLLESLELYFKVFYLGEALREEDLEV
ncbi:MAG: hypothetical protein HFI74_08595 [Lachnospiraceae bacterium]|nr:hypothetical protein [Lachnospiraceae bacterium]